jgi:hypothetical protein
MTNQEAIELLGRMKSSLEPSTSLMDACFDVYKALDLAIKALTDLDNQVIFIGGGRSGKRQAILDYLRPKGNWIYVQYDANPNIGNYHCSECHYIPVGSVGVQVTNFCPNCGAKMYSTPIPGGNTDDK